MWFVLLVTEGDPHERALELVQIFVFAVTSDDCDIQQRASECIQFCIFSSCDDCDNHQRAAGCAQFCVFSFTRDNWDTHKRLPELFIQFHRFLFYF